jgi:hypothetical protein
VRRYRSKLPQGWKAERIRRVLVNILNSGEPVKNSDDYGYLKHKSLIIYFAIFINLQFMLFQLIFRSRGISPDFSIFYDTSKRFLSGENLYFPENGDPGFAPTLLYFLFSPLTFLDRQTASNLFIILNYIFLFLIILLLIRFLPPKQLLILLTVLNASFSVRSVINNGQIGVIVLLLQLIYIVLMEKNVKNTLFLKSAIVFILLELKPYLMLPYYLYLIVAKKKEALIVILYALLFECFYFLINPTSTILYYVRLLIKRSQETGKESDQSSALYLLNDNKIMFIIYLFLILILTYKKFPKSEKERTILLFLLAPLVSIYFHRQDSVFAILICALLLPKINQYFSALLIFLLLHTGTFNIYFLVQLLLMLFALVILIPLRKRVGLFVLLGLIIHSALVNLLYENFGYQAAYRLWTPYIFVFQFLVFIYYIKFNKNDKLISYTEKKVIKRRT